jgi:hypothetical protein
MAGRPAGQGWTSPGLPEGILLGDTASQWLGLAVLALVGWLLYRVSTRKDVEAA